MSSRAAAAAAPASGGKISGRVVTADNEVVQGASVQITSGPSHPDIAAVTNARGDFSLPAPTAGEYQITVHKSGYQSQTVRVNTATGGTVTVTLRPRS